MDSKYIIQEGDVAKYQLTITHADFDQQHDEFFVIIHDGAFDHTTTIAYDEIYHDEEYNYFIAFHTAGMAGRITAETHYLVPDTDLATGIREEIDYQYIGFVTSNPCPRFLCDCDCMGNDEAGGNHVEYNRVYLADMNTLYLNVRTSEGQPVLTSDGKQVRVRKENT